MEAWRGPVNTCVILGHRALWARVNADDTGIVRPRGVKTWCGAITMGGTQLPYVLLLVGYQELSDGLRM